MAKLNFKNKWVLVTGASSGLGRAIALYMAKKEYANLVVAARRTELLEQLKTWGIRITFFFTYIRLSYKMRW